MIGLSTIFASSAPAVHIAPQTVFTIGGVNITNSILFGWIALIIICTLFIWVARRMTIKPKGGIIQYIEVIADFITGTVEGAFDDTELAQKYILYFITVFFFILVNNIIGLVPGVGEPFLSHGNALFRPFTADFNSTLAMAAVTMGLVYISSIRELGIRKYVAHFFVGSVKNPLYLFIGIIEIITDLTRIVSLSLRLFLNVAIGEIIIVVFSWLGHIIAPITATPFFFIDLFDDLLQAFIFVLLGAMYIAIAVNHGSEHDANNLTEGKIPETMEVTS
jgi:F-type H+-transporting ATPase subunit a